MARGITTVDGEVRQAVNTYFRAEDLAVLAAEAVRRSGRRRVHTAELVREAVAEYADRIRRREKAAE